jgi:hypothetical protein
MDIHKISFEISEELSHKNSNVSDILIIEKVLNKYRPGPTGNFPDGSLNPLDKGELSIEIGTTQDMHIIVNFGTELEWIGFDIVGAQNFVDLLQQRIDAIKTITG